MDDAGLPRGSIENAELLAGGSQNILLRIERGGVEYVLRRPPVHKRTNSDESLRREARVLAALAGSDVPPPTLLGAYPDVDVLGGAFILMESIMASMLEMTIRIRSPLRFARTDSRRGLRERFEPIIGSPRDLGRESSKVVEALVTESMYDGPINILIGMHCDISKADRSLHLAREWFIDDSQFAERVQCAAHRFRSRMWRVRHHDWRNVDSNLAGSCEIERDEFLKIRIRRKLRYFFGTPTADSLDTALQGLQFLVDWFPIHFLRFSARIRFR